MQACPTNDQISSLTQRQWPPQLVPFIDRQPDLTMRLTEMLQMPGEVQAYMDRECTEFLLTDAEQTTRVANFVGHNPAPTAGEGNATAVCADAAGVFHNFYQCAPGCAAAACSTAWLFIAPWVCGKPLLNKILSFCRGRGQRAVLHGGALPRRRTTRLSRLAASAAR